MTEKKKSVIERLKNGMEMFFKPAKAATMKNFKVPLTLEQQIAQIVRTEQFCRMVERDGFETYEESEDFDVPDRHNIPAFHSTCEFQEMHEVKLKNAIQAGREEISRARLKKEPAAGGTPTQGSGVQGAEGP